MPEVIKATIVYYGHEYTYEAGISSTSIRSTKTNYGVQFVEERRFLRPTRWCIQTWGGKPEGFGYFGTEHDAVYYRDTRYEAEALAFQFLKKAHVDSLATCRGCGRKMYEVKDVYWRRPTANYNDDVLPYCIVCKDKEGRDKWN